MNVTDLRELNAGKEDDLRAIGRQQMAVLRSFTRLPAVASCWPTDKGTLHSYLPIYEELLGPLRLKPITLLEIGAGWSMFMWRQWLPWATVHVIDKEFPANLRPEPQLVLHEMRQEDEQRLAALKDLRFDVIIDDGSHRPADQLLTCHYLWRCLKPGGYYFVEDVPAPDRVFAWEMMPGFRAWVNLKDGRQDDILVMLRKPK